MAIPRPTQSTPAGCVIGLLAALPAFLLTLGIWGMLRDWLCNRRWSSLDDLLEAATLWLKKFWSAPDRILSLVGDGWMLHQANA